MILKLIYWTLLLIMYTIFSKFFDISLNYSTFIFFAALTCLNYFADNFDFSKQLKKNIIWVNGISFTILLISRRDGNVFLLFLLFSTCEIILYRIFRNLYFWKIKDRYMPFVFNYRNVIKFIIDIGSICLGWVLAFVFKYEDQWYLNMHFDYFSIFLNIFIFGYTYEKISKKSWSYTNIFDVFNLVTLNIASSIVFLIFLKGTGRPMCPISILLMLNIISLATKLFGRYIFRVLRYYNNRNTNRKGIKRALIYGAGEAGAILARESYISPNFPYKIIGFIDDDIKKVGTEIYQVKVLGTMDAIQKIIANERIDEVLLAIPSIKGEKIRNILEELKEIEDIEVKTVPGIPEILEGRELAGQLRNVRIEDLLGRDEICINDSSIRGLIEGQTIFVTGGAGSIGSELARQIARYNPERLVAIDINENDIYFLELELHRLYPNLNYVSEICNIREKEKLEFLFQKYRPDIVFHAAAHKHVPLMEHNPEEAIKNNIFGTKNVAECAEKYKVQRMVLISTDKAVNPTNLMGASKRACELVIEHMSKIAKNTKFMTVRFGNVLGSHGSVIPIFRNLIEQGKNLTVTHKDITRYFMTIPEAAQLVIEAGSMGNGGEIFILDMGKPVRIYDLAQSMIKLSNANIGIDIVGLRPGEKLYEELLYDVNNATKTKNKKIFITEIHGARDITKFYDKLWDAVNNPDIENIKKVMKEIVVSYKEVNYE